MTRARKSDEPPVHNRLAQLRARDGLSRAALADALGVHYQTVGYLERGEYKPSLVVALQAARLFGVRVEDVFSFEPFPDALPPELSASLSADLPTSVSTTDHAHTQDMP